MLQIPNLCLRTNYVLCLRYYFRLIKVGNLFTDFHSPTIGNYW